jgi:hypothetical protein
LCFEIACSGERIRQQKGCRTGIRRAHLLTVISIHPLAPAARQEADEFFAIPLFESMTVHIPVTGTEATHPSPLCNIIHGLLQASSYPLLHESEPVAALLSSRVLDRRLRKNKQKLTILGYMM